LADTSCLGGNVLFRPIVSVAAAAAAPVGHREVERLRGIVLASSCGSCVTGSCHGQRSFGQRSQLGVLVVETAAVGWRGSVMEVGMGLLLVVVGLGWGLRDGDMSGGGGWGRPPDDRGGGGGGGVELRGLEASRRGCGRGRGAVSPAAGPGMNKAVVTADRWLRAHEETLQLIAAAATDGSGHGGSGSVALQDQVGDNLVSLGLFRCQRRNLPPQSRGQKGERLVLHGIGRFGQLTGQQAPSAAATGTTRWRHGGR